MKLSKNFALEELIFSNTANTYGLDNSPTTEHLTNLKELVKSILQPARDGFCKPININSGYRCKRVNDKIKGSSKTSDHLIGCAADLDVLTKGKSDLMF